MLKWLLRGFVGAVVAGLGWKLGADAYEGLKKRMQKKEDKENKPAEENGAGAAQVGTPDPKTQPSRTR